MNKRLEQKRLAQKRYRERHPDRIKVTRDSYNAKNPGLNAERCRKWQKKNAQSLYLKALFNRTGLTKSDYKALIKRAKGRCEICKTTKPRLGNKRLVVDHDHKSKQIRGLLCSNCNVALGYFKDDTKLITNAINYLKAHNE